MKPVLTLSAVGFIITLTAIVVGDTLYRLAHWVAQ
jgi:hypothetical protein